TRRTAGRCTASLNACVAAAKRTRPPPPSPPRPPTSNAASSSRGRAPTCNCPVRATAGSDIDGRRGMEARPAFLSGVVTFAFAFGAAAPQDAAPAKPKSAKVLDEKGFQKSFAALTDLGDSGKWAEEKK